MKITKSQLKQIIKEEISKVLKENDYQEKRKWFEEEGWKSLDAKIWASATGHGDVPLGVDEGDFQERLRDEFKASNPQSYEEAVAIFNEIYDSMEEEEAGEDI